MPSALVTGGSRGIGLGIARRLAERGYDLTLTARDQERLTSAAGELRTRGAPQVHVVAADLAAPETAQLVVEEHRQRFGAPRALVLSAGVGTAGHIDTYPSTRYDKTFTVDLRAPFLLLQHSLPLLRKAARRDPRRGARVVALSSITGVYAESGLAAYGAAKAGLISIIETFNAEESVNGVSATALSPG